MFFWRIQGKIAKQLKDYLLRDPLSQFSFPGSQNVFMKDTPSVNPPVPTTSVRKPEVGRQSASPKTVSAAVTLSGLERARDGEFQCTGRPSSPANTDACVVSGVGSSDVDRMRSPRLRPGVAETEEAFDKPTTFKEIGMRQVFSWGFHASVSFNSSTFHLVLEGRTCLS